MKPVRKVIQNKLKAQELRTAGVKVFPMEEILGSMTVVKDFAAFGMKNREHIEVLRSQLLLDYAEGTFSPEEFSAFRLGLDSMLKAFENSESDTLSYLSDIEQAKKSVG